MPQWDEWAYIQIKYYGDRPGALTRLWDIGCPVTAPILLPDIEKDDRWEEWKEPKDYNARKDEIYKPFPEHV